MGKKVNFNELTDLLQYLLAEETPGQYSLSRKDERSYELYKSSYDVHLVCTIVLPTPTAANALPSAWAKLEHAGKYTVRHLKDGSLVLE